MRTSMAPSWRSGDLGASGDRRGLDRERLAARIGVPMSAIEAFTVRHDLPDLIARLEPLVPPEAG